MRELLSAIATLCDSGAQRRRRSAGARRETVAAGGHASSRRTRINALRIALSLDRKMADADADLFEGVPDVVAPTAGVDPVVDRKLAPAARV